MSASLSPTDKPLAWIGSDRLLLNDRTIYGLHRKVFARKDDMPNMVQLLQAAFQEARDAKVHWWLVEKDVYFFLWILWKEG